MCRIINGVNDLNYPPRCLRVGVEKLAGLTGTRKALPGIAYSTTWRENEGMKLSAGKRVIEP